MNIRRSCALAGLGLTALLGTGCATGGDESAYEVSSQAKQAGWIGIVPQPVEVPTSQPVGSAPRSAPEAAKDDVTVIVNVWASYCAPCIDEMPLLEEAAAARDLVVIGLTRDASDTNARELISKLDIQYDNYMDPTAAFAIDLDGAIPLNSIPTSVLIDDGRAVAVHIGAFETVDEVIAVLPS